MLRRVLPYEACGGAALAREAPLFYYKGTHKKRQGKVLIRNRGQQQIKGSIGTGRAISPGKQGRGLDPRLTNPREEKITGLLRSGAEGLFSGSR
jgi:hypothetical protein